MLILRRCLVASAILVVALWLLWWASAGFPARIEVCETGGKPCGSYNFPLGSILKVVTILDRYGALITAISTIAIAIFTYILYGATNALVAVERDRRSTVGGGGAKALHDPNFFTIVATNAGPGSAILRRLRWGFEDLGVIPPTPRYDGGDIQTHEPLFPGRDQAVRHVRIPERGYDRAVIFFRFDYWDVNRRRDASIGFVLIIEGPDYPRLPVPTFDVPPAYLENSFPLES
jgi:hypothetical protein